MGELMEQQIGKTVEIVAKAVMEVTKTYIEECVGPGLPDITVIEDLNSGDDFECGFEIGFTEGIKALREKLLGGLE